MAIELVTGYMGKPHVSSDQAGAFNAGLCGLETYIMPTGAKCKCTANSNASVTISSGDIVCQGRHIHITGNETVAIENGTQGLKRNDLVGIDYVKESSTGKETVRIAVVKGQPGYSPSDPSYSSGSIINGASHVFAPLYRIQLDGINIQPPQQVAETLVPMSEMHRMILGRIKNEAISDWNVAATEDALDRPGLRFTKKDDSREYLLIFDTTRNNKHIQMWDCKKNESVWSY